MTRPYHHGNLRAELLGAAVALAREGGPDAVVLREVGRRAEVSHNAAYRHFADREAFLAEVAEQGLTGLARAMEQRLAAVRGPHVTRPLRRLAAAGEGYVRYALAEPGLFRTAFATATHPSMGADGYGAGASGRTAYQLLGDCLDAMVDSGDMPRARRPGAEVSCWAGVHGLASLLLDGPLRELDETMRRQALTRLLQDLAAGVTAAHAPAVHAG